MSPTCGRADAVRQLVDDQPILIGERRRHALAFDAGHLEAERDDQRGVDRRRGQRLEPGEQLFADPARDRRRDAPARQAAAGARSSDAGSGSDGIPAAAIVARERRPSARRRGCRSWCRCARFTGISCRRIGASPLPVDRSVGTRGEDRGATTVRPAGRPPLERSGDEDLTGSTSARQRRRMAAARPARAARASGGPTGPSGTGWEA